MINRLTKTSPDALLRAFEMLLITIPDNPSEPRELLAALLRVLSGTPIYL